MLDKTKTRPLSPHLSIYRPQISSVLSILHRMTGIYLFIGMLVLVWWIILAVYSSFSPEIARWEFFVDNLFGRLFLLGWTFALYYHLFNGIRHLFWDIGKGYELKTMKSSGIAVIVLTLILTIVSWGIAMNN